ncbi:holo-ACP synthase [Treponema sp.]|uniref:holo-ACP synthase n=1 Tax=Treponema sp. TaxID=166 RepID=UPI00388E5924
MIFGTGTDIVKVSRLEKWVNDRSMIERYFNAKEIKEADYDSLNERQKSALCQHYAARFAAKEAFSKALGIGITGFDLRDVYIQNEESGKPYIVLENSAEKVFQNLCPGARLFVSLSHEKEYALANVIIEN